MTTSDLPVAQSFGPMHCRAGAFSIGHDKAVQGNLEPLTLLADRETIRQRAKDVLDLAARRPGHIFNLGHGVLQQTPVENAIALVEAVHELSAG